MVPLVLTHNSSNNYPSDEPQKRVSVASIDDVVAENFFCSNTGTQCRSLLMISAVFSYRGVQKNATFFFFFLENMKKCPF